MNEIQDIVARMSAVELSIYRRAGGSLTGSQHRRADAHEAEPTTPNRVRRLELANRKAIEELAEQRRLQADKANVRERKAVNAGDGRMRDPQTKGEWQDAVDAAKGALALDAARRYGLVSGGPKVNVERCEQILDAGASRKIYPSRDAIEDFVASAMRLQEKRKK